MSDDLHVLSARVEALVDRIAMLEARPSCRCSSCRDDVKRAEDQACRERGAAIARMPVAEALAALKSEPYRRFVRIVPSIGLDQVVAIAVAAEPDQRNAIMAAVDQSTRDYVRVELMRPWPHHMVIEQGPNKRAYHDVLGPAKIAVDLVTAMALLHTGLQVAYDRDGSGEPIRAFYLRPNLAHFWFPTVDQYQQALRVDAGMRAAIVRGVLAARDATEDEDRGAALASLQADRERAADHAHLSQQATAYGAMSPAIPT